MDSYRKFFEDSPAPMYIYDEETYAFLAVNDAALNQYGYTRSEFLSMTVTQIRPEEEIALFKQTSIDVSDAYLDFGRWRHMRKNGEIFYVHIYAHATEFDNRKARFVFAVDIDKKVKNELALLEKTREMHMILESITDAFFAVNTHWEFTFANRAFSKMFRHPKEEFLGKKMWDLFPHGKSMRLYREYMRAMNEKISVHFEAYDAQYDIWVSVNAYPTSDGIAVFGQNITERKKSQEKFFNDEHFLGRLGRHSDVTEGGTFM